jgi:phosphohistidine phosphatase
MKRVIIVRHAKAVPYGYDDDFRRDLTERGISDAHKISNILKQRGIFADGAIASPATRTMHTATIFCKNLGFPPENIRQEEILYHGLTTQDFIALLHELPESMQTVFVFGHNPTVYYLVNNLANYFNAEMPTCSTVAIDFGTANWTEISARKGIDAFHYIPKEK